MLSIIEWLNEAEESDAITDFPGSGRAMPVNVIEEAQELAVNCIVVFRHPPSWSILDV